MNSKTIINYQKKKKLFRKIKEFLKNNLNIILKLIYFPKTKLRKWVKRINIF